MYKIDFEKAYDWVDQEFMRLTLSEFGFPSYKKNLMMNCVISTSLALRWKNEVLHNFAPNRGLRQEDPLSPYLFVLCMEKLALLIQKLMQFSSWLCENFSKWPCYFSLIFYCR